MRVLHIITDLGGPEREALLATILESSPGKRDETAVITLSPAGPLRENFQKKGVRTYTLRMRRDLWSPLAAVRLARIVNVFSPDIVHGWMHPGSFAASLASAMMTKPVSLIWNIPEAVDAVERNRGIARLNAWISGAPDAIVYDSSASCRLHHKRGFAPNNSLVIPRGVDFSLHKPDASARNVLDAFFGIDPNLLVVGLLAGRDRVSDMGLVEAVARARAEGPDLHLLVLGNGPQRFEDDIAGHALQHLPAERVSTARIDGNAAWLPGNDVLVTASDPTQSEIAMALACGVPVICGENGDTPSLAACRAIMPCTDPEAATAALIKLARTGPDERRKMGIAARDKGMELYALESIARRYHDLHRRLFDDARYLGTPVLRRGSLAEGSQR